MKKIVKFVKHFFSPDLPTDLILFNIITVRIVRTSNELFTLFTSSINQRFTTDWTILSGVFNLCFVFTVITFWEIRTSNELAKLAFFDDSFTATFWTHII